MENHIEINNSGFIYRNNNSIVFSNQINDEPTLELLMELKKLESKYQIQLNPYYFEEDNKILKGLNNAFFIFMEKKISSKVNKYILNEGDIFKLGRIILRVKEIKLKNPIIKTEPNNNYDNKNEQNNNNITDINILPTSKIFIPSSKLIKVNNKENKKICRICYGNEDNIINPLIKPCSCSGTMKFIHYECLKHWIKTHLCIKLDNNENCTIFIIKEIECELCKKTFPDYLKHNDKLYEILDFHDYYKKYIVLETLILDSRKNKFIYVINLEKNSQKLKIGRGKESDVLLTDVSVSRIHSSIIREGYNIFLQDENSKFGTLILIQSSVLNLSSNLPLNIQIGRSFFNITVKKSFSIFNCCDCDKKINKFYYHKQSQKAIEYNRFLNIKEESELKDDVEVNQNSEINILKINNDESESDEKLDVVNELNYYKKINRTSNITFIPDNTLKVDKKTRNNNNIISIPYDSTEINPV